MQLLIDRDANMVTINGTTRPVDTEAMAAVVPVEIARIRWFDDHGEVHYRDGKVTGLGDIQRFKPIVDAWFAAGNKMATR